MNQDQIKEALAKKMAFATRQRNDVSEDATEFWAHTGDMAKSYWLTAAAAVIALAGPKGLVWKGSSFKYCTTPTGQYQVREAGSGFYALFDAAFQQVVLIDSTTTEAAQAAAQDHADASHWANMAIAGEKP